MKYNFKQQKQGVFVFEETKPEIEDKNYDLFKEVVRKVLRWIG
jgi:hypothetical protein